MGINFSIGISKPSVPKFPVVLLCKDHGIRNLLRLPITDSPLVQHKDLVGADNRVQTVSDDDYRFVFHEVADRATRVAVMARRLLFVGAPEAWRSGEWKVSILDSGILDPDGVPVLTEVSA